MHRSLSEYIALLEREGELVRIAAPVSPVEEIAEITDRVSKMPGGGKALLFENTGTDFPVLTNMFGSARRMALALGVGSLGELGTGRRIAAAGHGAAPVVRGQVAGVAAAGRDVPLVSAYGVGAGRMPAGRADGC